MNEREQFLQQAFARIASTVERIQTMTETQVLHQLRAIRALRDSNAQTLAFLNSTSLVPEDSEDQISNLRSKLSSYPRPSGDPFDLDYIEDALNKRLETLRKNSK
jgi:hypothetical protein